MTKEEYNKIRQGIIDKRVNRQRQIDEGYTYAQEAAEWGDDPKNRTDLGLWLDEKKKSLHEMIFGEKEPKAHDEIDKLIAKDSIL